MLTLPNILTLSRIFAVPLLVGLLWFPQWQTGYAFAFALYCLMGITDYFDGYLARANGTVSKLGVFRSEEHTSELQSLMRISYAVFCFKKKTKNEESKMTAQQAY